jgi:hypothetical protein
MKSPQFIRAQLSNRTNADCSEHEVKNNRYHYHLKFKEERGWDWTYGQVQKASSEIGVNLELWKIRPSGVASYEIEIREVDRREGIDADQRGLGEFES